MSTKTFDQCLDAFIFFAEEEFGQATLCRKTLQSLRDGDTGWLFDRAYHSAKFPAELSDRKFDRVSGIFDAHLKKLLEQY